MKPIPKIITDPLYPKVFDRGRFKSSLNHGYKSHMVDVYATL